MRPQYNKLPVSRLLINNDKVVSIEFAGGSTISAGDAGAWISEFQAYINPVRNDVVVDAIEGVDDEDDTDGGYSGNIGWISKN